MAMNEMIKNPIATTNPMLTPLKEILLEGDSGAEIDVKVTSRGIF